MFNHQTEVNIFVLSAAAAVAVEHVLIIAFAENKGMPLHYILCGKNPSVQWKNVLRIRRIEWEEIKKMN